MAERLLTFEEAAARMGFKSAKPIHRMVGEGELRAVQLGPRRLWRVRASELEAWIQRQFGETAGSVAGPGA
jgi:excisionase family DNA binding protein